MKIDKKTKTLIWVEAILLAAAAFLKFALIGYSTSALTLIFIAAVVAVFCLLGKMSLKHRKAARFLRGLLIALLVIGAAAFTIAEINVIGAAHTDEDPGEPYLVVLGAGVNGTEPSLSLLNRLDAAKSYLDEYPDAYVIVSGGQGAGEDITEAECMRLWLEDAGIDAERIICEDRATTTEENLSFSLDIIDTRGDDPEHDIAVVSSEYHLYRAKQLAAALGANVKGVAAKTTNPFLRVNYFIREGLAGVYVWIFGI